ncbi:hypothetical protein [Arthrobacter sp. ISL-65]|uniref:hypothetical protein n=1 Tax=Arthrobacter sp. ISL-65 TaxID=2819112 RepID=UPI001BE6BFC3|nr:hypothetical protein [Arthrobacter sp. ISL-65]MBT2549799.1 hypothetical protein [Arthrobacter sp. ISL-65]
MKRLLATAGLVSLFLVAGCAHRATPEEVRASELAARSSRSAAAAADIPDSVKNQTKTACENDLRFQARTSNGKSAHAVQSVQFVGDVSEYDLRNRPHAYDIVVSYDISMTATGEVLSYKKTCRVGDDGDVDWMAA